MKARIQKIKEWYLTYERHLTTGAFVTGFIVDNFTLTRIDLLFDNLVLATYLSVAIITILLVGAAQRGIFPHALFVPVRSVAPLAMQFAFGGLFSGFFIFYTRSASLEAAVLVHTRQHRNTAVG